MPGSCNALCNIVIYRISLQRSSRRFRYQRSRN